MRLSFYGGVHEIGGNKILCEYNNTRLMLDFGTSMGYTSTFFSDFLQPRTNTFLHDQLTIGAVPRIDGIYRDDLFSPIGSEQLTQKPYIRTLTSDSSYLQSTDAISYETYKKTHKTPFLHGILLTHAHLDHTGAIRFLHPEIPLYCTAVTKTLVSAIDDVTSFTSEALQTKTKHLSKTQKRSMFPEAPLIQGVMVQRPCITLSDTELATVKSITFHLLEQDHSVPGSASFLVYTPETSLLYTGDIRFHGSKPITISSYVKKIHTIHQNLDVMICEGTRIDSQKIVTEKHVEEQIAKDIKKTDGLVFVDFSWKDTTRFETIAQAAKKADRTFVINARLAYLLHSLAVPFDEQTVKVFLKRKGSCLYSPADYANSKYELGYSIDFKQNMDTTHYQNGLVAADIRKDPSAYVVMLSYYDLNQLFDLADSNGKIQGSRFIKAQCAPFSDEMELDEERFINWLDSFGIAYTLDDTPLPYSCQNSSCEKLKPRLQRAHVSGHAARPELTKLIKQLAPRTLLPVHTQHPELFVDIVEETSEDIQILLPEKGTGYTFL